MRNGTYESRDFRDHDPNFISCSRGSMDGIYVSLAHKRSILTALRRDFLGEAGGHSCLSLCPVFNTNTTFWTKYLSGLAC